MKRYYLLLILLSCKAFEAEKDNVSLDSEVFNENFDNIVKLELKNENIDLLNPNDTSRQVGGDSIIVSKAKNKKKLDPFLWFANVPSPVYRGKSLQANTVFIYGKYAFVGFNMKGEEYLGAVMTINLDNILFPKIVQVVTIINGDVNTIYFRKNVLYVGGATNAYNEPAFMMTADVNSSMRMSNIQFYDYPSYGVTDFTKRNSHLMVSVGESSGGIVRAKLNEISNFTFRSENNARAVISNSSNIFLLTAYPARIHWYDKQSFTLVLRSNFFNGASQKDAKSTLELEGKTVVAAVGDGGTHFFKAKSNKTLDDLGFIPQIDFRKRGLALEKTTTNAATAEGSFLFTSSGEAGVHCYYFTNNKSKVINVSQVQKNSFYVYSGYMSFGTGISVNHVKYKNNYLLIASGLGGVQIVRFVPGLAYLPSGPVNYDDNDDYDD